MDPVSLQPLVEATVAALHRRARSTAALPPDFDRD